MVLTVEYLWSIFVYKDGLLYRKITIGNGKAGTRAGTIVRGYYSVGAGGKYYKMHRLIWFMHYGRWPLGGLDHINRDKLDNRIENLREVSQAINMQNQVSAQSHNTTGLLGASKDGNRFQSNIITHGKKIFLGRFDSAEEAHEVYMKAKQQLHKEAITEC